MDIGTGLALFGSAKLIEKLLGPTADYIGEGIKSLAKKRTNNLKNIFSIAVNKLGNKIETQGAVPPKVLKGILDEGSFCDDFLSAEYFGGVLASSRSGVSRDDRGAALIALISRLSTYQIRTHYIFYHIVKKLFDGSGINIGITEGRNKMETYVPLSVYKTAMEFDKKENIGVLMTHIMVGLAKECLIGEYFSMGPKEDIEKRFNKATESGLIFQPSSLGTELFLWAYGKSDFLIQDFLEPVNQFEIDAKINIPLGYKKTKE